MASLLAEKAYFQVLSHQEGNILWIRSEEIHIASIGTIGKKINTSTLVNI
jgi:hypothetical protein